MRAIRVTLPLAEEIVEDLKAGDEVLINGTIYTARDAAHQRLVNLIREDKPLPFSLKDQVFYYTAPTPPKPGRPFGSCGPTTSCRMDKYTPLLLSRGVKGMIGKGQRSDEVREAIKKYKAVYFLALGGAGAYLSRKVKRAEAVAFIDLGPEAIYKLWVEDFPVIVGIDTRGEDVYQFTLRRKG